MIPKIRTEPDVLIKTPVLMYEQPATIRILKCEPGNGTSYQIAVVGPLLGSFYLGELGSADNGAFLIVDHLTKRAMLISGGDGPLYKEYVHDKLKCHEGDAVALTRLIAAATGRAPEGLGEN